jgi:linoleate 10R-lipoxygenase
MFSFAALVIHTVFRTSHENVNINATSPYFDLAPLYGHNEETVNRIRWRTKGRGRIFPDSFAEDRLMLLPPAVGVLLVLFSRNHNYIANKLFEIDEHKTYTERESMFRIAPDDLERQKKISDQDEDIFQTARLINCAWFRATIFSDYFSSILGLVRQGSTSSFNPFREIRDDDYKVFERDRGNVCSVEFNCLYRWHATTSEADEKWVERVMSAIFPGKPIGELSSDNFKCADKRIRATDPDLSHWTLGKLRRRSDGTFNDGELTTIIKDAVEQPAATFGARGTPHSMRLHEIMGIEANRRWGVCSLNEFREFLGLKPYASFLDWNSNKEIAEAAERLYSHIDNLELYVGLQGEEAKKPFLSAGLCPGVFQRSALFT